MKKIIIAVAIIAVLVPFIPIPRGSYDDGGTREYDALLYKLVVWNKLTATVSESGVEDVGVYHATSIYFYPESKLRIDELWKLEQAKNK